MVIIDIDVEMTAASVAARNSNSTVQADNLKTRFPSAFYDAKTRFLLGDPVVNQRGESVERESALENVHLYPNRALKSLIASEVDFIFANPKYTKLEGLSWDLCESRSLPDQFYCPITRDLMMEPVVSPDGYTFDREAIESWIKHENETCPVSRMPLKQSQLRRNLALQECIQAEVSRPYNVAHEDVKRWKDSKLATSLAEAVVAAQPKRPGPPASTTLTPTRLPQPSGPEHRATAGNQTQNEQSRVPTGRRERILMMGIFLVGFVILIFMNALQ